MDKFLLSGVNDKDLGVFGGVSENKQIRYLTFIHFSQMYLSAILAL